ncbi:ABC transporter G family member 10-like [Salvia hispanica]|uniref:ABC transporter G family member 10-like n=1 Tax=Salvia hispanica TaxID=49212 RepID=UPI00200979CC|nr:ABC transporter G family member 10-like [Salvia hispanica]
MEPPIISHQQITHYKLNTENVSYKLSPTHNWLPSTLFVEDSQFSKFVLRDVTCDANPGQLTAIAGPSGAGKTTLLDILAGMIIPARLSGSVLVNNRVMDPDHFRRVAGYVTQDDALFPLLTVEETLTYSACLRLKAGRDKAAARVQKLLKELGLEHISGVRVGDESSRGISGGEKRRVSIGVDLVHDPSVLLLDEPTSGLDSASALHVISLLKSMAKNQHKTIVVTIHQPGFRILDLIDHVILLSNGSVMHNGSLEFLEERIKAAGHVIPCRVNVLEFAIDAANEALQQEQGVQVEDVEAQKQIDVDEDDFLVNNHEREKHDLYCNSHLDEVFILSHRFARNILRTKQLFAAKTIQSLLVGIVLGTIFIDAFGENEGKKVQNQVGFFAFTLTFLISTTTEALPVFLQERRILERETSRGAYRISSYMVANTLVFLPFLLIVALLYATPVYWIVGLTRNISQYLYFTMVVWMVILMANSFVACCSVLVPDFITGMSLTAGVMGAFFLFSGYFLTTDSIPKCWNFMQYLSVFKYPYESFVINEFGGEEGRAKCMERIEGECLIYGHGFLIRQGLKESQKWINLFMMMSFIIGYRFLGYVFLWYKCYKTRN